MVIRPPDSCRFAATGKRTQNSFTGSTRRRRFTVPVSRAKRRSSAAGNILDKAVRRGVDCRRAMGTPPLSSRQTRGKHVTMVLCKHPYPQKRGLKRSRMEGLVCCRFVPGYVVLSLTPRQRSAFRSRGTLAGEARRQCASASSVCGMRATRCTTDTSPIYRLRSRPKRSANSTLYVGPSSCSSES
jgi:hypothetical protein